MQTRDQESKEFGLIGAVLEYLRSIKNEYPKYKL